MNIQVKKPTDLKVPPGEADGQKSVFDQLRGAWWMCPDNVKDISASKVVDDPAVSLELISMGAPSNSVPFSSNIVALLGDTYHKFKVARLFSGNKTAMRDFIRENYRFHLEWFEETIRAAGLPQHFDPDRVRNNEILAIYAVVQRLVHELVSDGNDRGDRARTLVYGDVVDPLETPMANLSIKRKRTDS